MQQKSAKEILFSGTESEIFEAFDGKKSNLFTNLSDSESNAVLERLSALGSYVGTMIIESTVEACNDKQKLDICILLSELLKNSEDISDVMRTSIRISEHLNDEQRGRIKDSLKSLITKEPYLMISVLDRMSYDRNMCKVFIRDFLSEEHFASLKKLTAREQPFADFLNSFDDFKNTSHSM